MKNETIYSKLTLKINKSWLVSEYLFLHAIVKINAVKNIAILAVFLSK